MPRKPTGRPNGRPEKKAVPPVDPKSPPAEWKGTVPEKEINLDQVLYWTELQATAEEIAGAFRVSVDTLDRRLREAFGMGFAELKKGAMGFINSPSGGTNFSKQNEAQPWPSGLEKCGSDKEKPLSLKQLSKKKTLCRSISRITKEAIA
jgi:hypothetical protein